MTPRSIAILFSGGTDSSAVAVYYLKRAYYTHLLTFDNGAEKWLDLAEYKASRIAREFPNQSSWRLMDCTYLFHELAIKTLEEDVRRYGNLICCGCKLSMLCEAIIYCRRHGISELADGFKREQDYYPEQTPDYMGPAGRFAEKFRIKYIHPFYESPDLKPEEITLSGAVPPSPIQPYCIFGNNPVRDRRCIGPYVESKIPAMERYVTHTLSLEGEQE